MREHETSQDVRKDNNRRILATRARGQAIVAEAASAKLPYTERFYEYEGLRLQSYLFKPSGGGPFPLVIYNHGLRFGDERAQRRFFYVARLLTDAGYAVLVLERRGYGASDGPTFREEVRGDVRDLFVARL